MAGIITVSLDLTGRPAVVIGGGRVAERKVKVLMEAGARVRVVAPEVTAPLSDLETAGQIQVCRRPWEAGDTAGAMLVVAATGRREVDLSVALEAQAAGSLVSVSGDPALGNLAFTAAVKRGPVRIAISTGGAAPALAKRVRQEVERLVGPEYGALAELLDEARRRLKTLPGLSQSERAAVLEALVNGPALGLLARGETEAARAEVEERIRACE